MKKILSLSLLFVSIFLFSLFARGQGTAFSYQGRLNNNGAPVTGIYDLRFALYDAASSGNQVGNATTNSAVAVTNGLFTVTLDFGAGVFGGANRWLEIGTRTNGAGSFNTLSSRQAILSAPYAITASNLTGNLPASQLSGVLALSQLPAAVVTNNQTGLTLSGSFTGNGSGLTNIAVSGIGPAGTFALSTNLDFRTMVTLPANGPIAVATADVNADGDLDIISVDISDSALVVRTNNGNSGFTVSTNIVIEDVNENSPQGVTAADVNGDNKIDLISVNFYADTLTVVTNDGFGGFVIATNLPVGNGPTAAAVADVNGDSLMDIISADSSSNPGSLLNGDTLTVLTNDGAGGFVFANAFAVGDGPFAIGPSAVVATDLNGDAKIDLVSANSFDDSLTVLTNDGAGIFTVATNLATAASSSLVTADFNNDGKMDLASVGSSFVRHLAVFTNDGSGIFVEASAQGIDSNPKALTTGDFNGDGKTDLAIADGDRGDVFPALEFDSITILTNDGAGTFSIESAPSVGDNPQFVASGDFNDDGSMDLVSADIDGATLTVLARIPYVIFTSTAEFAGNGAGLTNVTVSAENLTGTISDSRLSPNVALLGEDGYFENLIGENAFFSGVLLAEDVGVNGVVQANNFIGNGSGLSNIKVSSVGPPGVFSLESFGSTEIEDIGAFAISADVNSDGSPDLITAGYFENFVMVLTNNGTGQFTPVLTNDVGANPYSVLAADINGDGKVDLITPNDEDDTLTVLTNNGDGTFTSAPTISVPASPAWVAAVDVDEDGRVDLISANQDDDSITVLTNSGSSIFISVATNSVGWSPSAITAVDINSDNHVDLITANQDDDTLTVLTNDSAGNFTVATNIDVGAYPAYVLAQDINGDNEPDLISANMDDGTLTVLTNDGAGNFTFSATLAVGGGANFVAAADINADGKTDLISSDADDDTLTILTGDGVGGFSLYQTLTVGDYPYTVTAVDINADGTIDLIAASDDDSVTVLTNSGRFAFTSTATFTGDGGGLTNLAASGLSGTIADARLSSNVALLNGTNSFTGTNTFAGVTVANNANNQFAGTFSGNGSGLTNIPLSGLQTVPLTNNQTGVTLGGTFSGNGSGLTSLNGANLANASVTPDKLSPTFGYFYLVNPLDVFAPIATGSAIPFPNNGPTNGISRVSSTEFALEAVGVYEITWQLSISEAGQLVLGLDGVEQPQTVVGRATGSSQIVGNVLIETTAPNTVLTVRNPSGNPTALTITFSAGGNLPTTGTLVIKRIK